MEGSDGSPPQSLCMIRASELYPKPPMEKEDTQLTVPFQELAGESVKYLGRTDDGVLALSNYRIFLLKNSTYSETSVPLGLIESAQTRDLFHLVINCKDASTVKCSFETAEQCTEWQRRIQLSVGVPETLESLFSFPFCSWTWDSISTTNGDNNSELSERLQRASRYEDDFMLEVERLQFDLKGSWRISHANEDFRLCPSYPQKILVPSDIHDETLHNVANFRGSRRLPAVVWRHKKSGAVIARSSQPEVGWLGWRNSKDEQLLKAIADACAFDRGEQNRRLNQYTSNESTLSSPDGSHEEVTLDQVRKILIVDARSYTSAVTNRARGGGCECIEYYPCAEIEFMNLGNIHVIRKSFHSLRALYASPPDVQNWLGLLEKTMWLQHLSGLLAASVTVCHAIEKKGRPVLVHCSDGWDRTPQIVATAQLCLDPFYRTVEGFRILVEREWLSFGHKFADRCGHGPASDDANERCPVFLQWLDLVHQIHKQFPCSFEFSLGYLIKLAQHSLSCLFGTFLCNTLKDRIENSVFERTFSVWPFLSGPMYRNPLYVANKEKVLWPAHNVRDLCLWTEVYLGSLGNQNPADFPPSNGEGAQGSASPMAKTRSYGDLITAGISQNGISRRSSDPNMTVDPKLIIDPNSESNSNGDLYSDRDESPDIITSFVHDTTEKLQNLTIELNHHDEEIFKMSLEKPKSNDTLKAITKITANNDKHEEMHRISEIKDIDDLRFLYPKQKTNEEVLQNVASQSVNMTASTCFSVSKDFANTLLPSYNAKTTIGTDPSLINMTEIPNGENEILYNPIRPSNDSDEVDSIRTIPATEINTDLMKSVNLDDNTKPEMATDTTLTEPISEDFLSAWHGSVNTSTDTLVPIDSQQQPPQQCQKTLSKCDENKNANNGIFDTNNKNTNATASTGDDNDDDDDVFIKTSAILQERSFILNRQFQKNPISNSTCSILPKVHSKSNLLITSSSSLNNHYTFNNANYRPHSPISNSNQDSINYTNNNTNASNSPSSNILMNNPMEESILILPEYQKLEISASGKCEFVTNNINGIPSSYRRRRTSSSNSRKDSKNITGSATISRFSTPGVRSLPLTPPGLVERSQIAISCPDGLAHALSEQNIRLQQIVHEHKVREDVLLREIHDMRMALLKKICPNCNNASGVNDEQVDPILREENKLVDFCNCCNSCINHYRCHCRRRSIDDDSMYFGSRPTSPCSVLDNVENLSICSWEAVEDRSGPSSSTSSIQPTTSVLWVPDHAVSRCTSCQIEFWLGRRKHHCRSCGQIFCADCSEFWAPLPDEKLFSPVRLCGPCYHSVTTRMQIQQLQHNQSRSISSLPSSNQGTSNHSISNNIINSTGSSTITTANISSVAASTIFSARTTPPPPPPITIATIQATTFTEVNSNAPITANEVLKETLKSTQMNNFKTKTDATAFATTIAATLAMTTASVSIASTLTSSTIEACKHVASPPHNLHSGGPTAAAFN